MPNPLPISSLSQAISALSACTRERDQLAEALRESRALLDRTQAETHLGTWVAETRFGGALAYSLETARIFGLPEDPLVGRVEDCFSLVHPDDAKLAIEAGEEALAGKTPFLCDVRIVRHDGAMRWIRSRADVIRDEAGHPVSIVGTAQDITDRKQLERELAQVKRLDALGQLAGGVAHDFNNLLTIVSGNLDLLEMDLPEVDRGEMLRALRYAAESGTKLTRQMLAFSREQVAGADVIDLNDRLRRIMGMLHRTIEEHVEMQVDLSPDLWPIRADPGHVEQIVVNLTVNARDAMPGGGRVEIRTANVAVPRGTEVATGPLPPGDYASLIVRDNGSGMDEATRARIFEPFFTTKGPRGTGLGLATVNGLVRQSGGHVGVDSAIGEGSAFTIYFPRAGDATDPAAPGSGRIATVLRAQDAGRTILLVEDDDGVRDTLIRILAMSGYRVLSAGNAADALEISRTHSGLIDVLVTDVIMAAMNGPSLAQIVTLERPETRVLFISGYTSTRWSEQSSRIHLLAKPFSAGQLLKKLEALQAT